jgi:prephenate dehydrogenase
MSDQLHIALIGAGQLGGSFALALRAADPSIRITAFDTNAAHASTLVDIGGANATAPTIAEAVSAADMVVLAAPVRAFRALAETMAPSLKPGTIVTDLGSVKCSMEPLPALLPHARVVPGHPIAGGEKAGVAVARADLFRGKLAVLTPLAGSDEEAVAAVETLWHLVGADVLQMPVPVHDHIYAYVSHLPHLVAFVAASFLHRQGVRVEASDATLQRFIRISRSNPRMWTDIFLENREALLPALAAYIAVLKHFADELRSGTSKNDANKTAIAKTQLPRILAASLISAVSLYEQQADLSLRPFGAGGMRDIAAPAAEDPQASALQEISDQAGIMATLIDEAVVEFTALEALIGAEDEAALFERIVQQVKDAESLIAPRQ